MEAVTRSILWENQEAENWIVGTISCLVTVGIEIRKMGMWTSLGVEGTATLQVTLCGESGNVGGRKEEEVGR